MAAATASARQTPTTPDPKPDATSDQPVDELGEFKSILHGYEWSYMDSLFMDAVEIQYKDGRPSFKDPLRFRPNGKFHDRWKWNYWIAGPGVIHVQYWDPVYKPETAVVLYFSEDRNWFSGEFKDQKGKVHKISGMRLGKIP